MVIMQTRGSVLLALLYLAAVALGDPTDTCTEGSVVILSGVTSPADLNGQYVKTTSEDFLGCPSDVYTNGVYYIASDGINWNWGLPSMGTYCPELLSGFIAYGPPAGNLSNSPGVLMPHSSKLPRCTHSCTSPHTQAT